MTDLYPWYSTTLEDEIIVNLVTEGHNDLHERLAAIMNQGPLGGVFPVGPPAAGSGSGKDKAAVLAALTAAKAAPTGGKVILWPGLYDVGDLAATLPDWNVANKQVSIEGPAGSIASTIKFSTDQGAGAYAIAGDGTLSGLYFNILRNVAIVGPGTRGAIGTSPAGMYGIRVDSRMILENVSVSGFRAGLVFAGNHTHLTRVTSVDNYYNAYFITSPTNGDNMWLNVLLDGALFASVAMDPTALATFTMVKGHLGFSPYGIYIEAGAGAGLSLGGCDFWGTSIEALGNSFIYSEDQSARVQGVSFHHCGNFSRIGAYALPSVTYNPMIYVAELIDVSFYDGMPPGPSDGPCFDVSSINRWQAIGSWKDSYNASITAGQDWIRGNAGGQAEQIRLLERNGFCGIAAPTDLDVVAGNVLEHSDLARLRPWGHYSPSYGLYAGVALNAAAGAGREYVVAVDEGLLVPVLTDGAAASSFAIVASTSSAGKGTGIAYTGTNAAGNVIIGKPYLGGVSTSPGTTQAHLTRRA